MAPSEEVAWVTGSSTGIGRAVALKLAEQGCDVAVHYNRSEAEAREVAERVGALEKVQKENLVGRAIGDGMSAQEAFEKFGVM